MELYKDEVESPLSLVDEISEQEEALRAELIQNSSELKLMCHTPGWKLLRAKIEEQIKMIKDALVYTTSLEQIVHFQEGVKSYQSILDIVDSTINEGNREQQILAQDNKS